LSNEEEEGLETGEDQYPMEYYDEQDPVLYDLGNGVVG
tara:strand:+ start:269 stop:382 length:114 start_codon:yes stop_codon:yes gene_type:complete